MVRHIISRLSVALVTFAIGVMAVSVWAGLLLHNGTPESAHNVAQVPANTAGIQAHESETSEHEITFSDTGFVSAFQPHYLSSDGAVLRYGCFDYGTSARAAAGLREEVSGRSVLERTEHLNESGKATGPRVVLATPREPETETTIVWTSGSRLFLLRGPSLRYALLFERSRAWANDRFCVPVPRINLIARRSPTKG